MEKLDLYKCSICGNVVQTIIVGGGELVCCGEPMHKLDAKTNEEGITEKHVPIFTHNDNQIEIKVGEILHPMLNEHYIQFIEAFSKTKNEMHLKYLNPNEEPVMVLKDSFDIYKALELCNIHGLWEGNKQ